MNVAARSASTIQTLLQNMILPAYHKSIVTYTATEGLLSMRRLHQPLLQLWIDNALIFSHHQFGQSDHQLCIWGLRRWTEFPNCKFPRLGYIRTRRILRDVCWIRVADVHRIKGEAELDCLRDCHFLNVSQFVCKTAQFACQARFLFSIVRCAFGVLSTQVAIIF